MSIHLLRGVPALIVLLAMSAGPVMAQSILEGKVTDAQGAPVEGATVVFESAGTSARIETKTNRSGEFFQLGLPSGEWKVTASKEGVGAQTLPTQVRQQRNPPMNFTLATATAAVPGLAPAAGGASAEAEKEAAALRSAALAGFEAARAGRDDEVIDTFSELVTKAPTCAECHFALATAHQNKRQYDEAEAAYQKVIELEPDNADAYSGLASVYNAQRKFDEAAAAGAKASQLSTGGIEGAAGGGNANALYTQGVISWNANRYEEAKGHLEAAIKADPSHALAHYQLGMVHLNLGQMPAAVEAFETYLTLEPEGDRAAEVKAVVQQLKQ